LSQGVKNFVGGNCTVSIMLMALSGLIKHNLVKWVSSASYQSISGGGANKVKEFIDQNKFVVDYLSTVKSANPDKTGSPLQDINQLTQVLQDALADKDFPSEYIGASLWGNVLPWIDVAMDNGQTKEEFKAGSEANKILGLAPNTIPIDGTCVRVGSLRSHALSLTICLNDSTLKTEELTQIIKSGNDWVKIIENNYNDTITKLTPNAVCGTLDIAVGRIRKLNLGDEFLSMFVIGDQLLWGAAEPLRRTLRIINQYLANK
jgi:aspartate-semialdehyde dehydrogenase